MTTIAIYFLSILLFMALFTYASKSEKEEKEVLNPIRNSGKDALNPIRNTGEKALSPLKSKSKETEILNPHKPKYDTREVLSSLHKYRKK